MRPKQIMKGIKKNVRGLRLLPFYLFTLFLLTIACSSIDCPVQNVVATVYGARKPDGKVDTLKDTLSVVIRNIKVKYTTLLENSTNTTKFQLPISYNNPEDTLVFIFKNKVGTYKDTLYVKKDNMPIFESVDCKISYFHTIKGVRLSSHNRIDSVSIVKTAVNYDILSEHFYIYFKANR